MIDPDRNLGSDLSMQKEYIVMMPVAELTMLSEICGRTVAFSSMKG
jgi:hypothetical protein